MKILVPVKEVSTLTDDFQVSGTAVPDQYVEYDLNEWDDYAIEEAVQIKEASDDDVEVVTVTIGPDRAEETIRMALAKEADRAVRVWDDAIEGQALLDVAAKTRILEAVVEEEAPDLVLSGVQAGDDAFAATGVALADAIDFQHAAVVTSLDLDEESADVRRELEGGVEELATVDLPAVMTIQTGINEPRYASLRGIRQAQQKEIAHYSLDDLGLDASVADSALALTDMYEPETEADTEYFEGGAGEQADQLAETLRDLGVGEA